jgi:hypothetical protein
MQGLLPKTHQQAVQLHKPGPACIVPAQAGASPRPGPSACIPHRHQPAVTVPADTRMQCAGHTCTVRPCAGPVS